jgi:hypothetical protein
VNNFLVTVEFGVSVETFVILRFLLRGVVEVSFCFC